MTRWLVATGNPGKLAEIAAILAPKGIDIVGQQHHPIPPVEETGQSFIENALLKARHAAHHAGMPVIADDSGLQVDALGGAPGIHSARYAGPSASDTANLEKLLQQLAGVPTEKRGARFRCVMVALRDANDPAPLIAEGCWEGSILPEPRGQNGFGYDPVFLIPELGLTAAELSAAEKNRRSHRGQALRALAALIPSCHSDKRLL